MNIVLVILIVVFFIILFVSYLHDREMARFMIRTYLMREHTADEDYLRSVIHSVINEREMQKSRVSQLASACCDGAMFGALGAAITGTMAEVGLGALTWGTIRGLLTGVKFYL